MGDLGSVSGLGRSSGEGDLPNPGIKPGCPALQADSLQSEPPKDWHIKNEFWGEPSLKVLNIQLLLTSLEWCNVFL